jgi:chromate transporter
MITTLIALCISFGKIGIVSLGGGNSMLKLIEFEAVTHRHWLNNGDFVEMVGTTFLFPGLTAMKLAALIGYQEGGVLGLLTAMISLNLPGILLCVIGFTWLSAHPSMLVNKIMTAVQYGALAMLGSALYFLTENTLVITFSWPLILLTILFFGGLTYLNVSPFFGFLGFIGLACILL